MTKHIHIHLNSAPTKDAGWQENKHPRRDDGKFGSGAGQRRGPSGRSFGERGRAAAKKVDTRTASEAYAQHAKTIAEVLPQIGDKHKFELRQAVARMSGAEPPMSASTAELKTQLSQALKEHAKAQALAHNAKDWGYAGDLSYVARTLTTAVKEHGPQESQTTKKG